LHKDTLWGELGGEDLSESVDGPWVGNVVLPVGDWTLSGDDGLNVESEHGEHSKTSVLDLLDLELREGIRVVSKTEWVEALTRVEGIEAFSGWATSYSVGFGESHEDNLASQDGDDALGVDQGWVAEVVKTTVGEDEGTGLEPRGVVGGVEDLRDDASESSGHGPSGVDQLALSVGGEGLWVGGETGGVPAVVTRVLTLEVGWAGVLRVWSEPLSSVWAVPHGGSGDDTRSLGGLGGGKFWESSDGKSHGYLLVGSKL